MIKNFFKGLLFGAAAGTVGGLLFAPRSGNETRKKLIEELEEATTLTNDLNNSLDHFKSALIETKETAESVIPAFQEAINKDIENFVESKRNWIEKHLQSLSKKQKLFENIEPYSDEEIRSFAKQAKEIIPKKVEFYAEKIGLCFLSVNMYCSLVWESVWHIIHPLNY